MAQDLEKHRKRVQKRIFKGSKWDLTEMKNITKKDIHNVVMDNYSVFEDEYLPSEKKLQEIITELEAIFIQPVTLKDFFDKKEVLHGLKSNLLNSPYHNNNQLSLDKLIDVNLIENNTLVLGKDTIEYGIYFDEHKQIYLFEARRFENDEKMVNALLLLFDSQLNILTDEIEDDDVWSYGDFELVENKF